jgi:hypothetical protein
MDDFGGKALRRELLHQSLGGAHMTGSGRDG